MSENPSWTKWMLQAAASTARARDFTLRSSPSGPARSSRIRAAPVRAGRLHADQHHARLHSHRRQGRDLPGRRQAHPEGFAAHRGLRDRRRAERHRRPRPRVQRGAARRRRAASLARRSAEKDPEPALRSRQRARDAARRRIRRDVQGRRGRGEGARGPDGSLPERSAATQVLRAAGRRPHQRFSPSGAHSVPPGRARAPDAVAAGADRRVAAPLPQPSERRVLRAGALGWQAPGRAGISLGARALEPRASAKGALMKFGLFYELSVPRPWSRESERTVYDNALEQVKLADELGFDQVWAVEHHFLEEYSHCPAPELFLTACAMVTKKIRVGFGIVVCVPEFNHPIKIAERTAVLDILSGGRVEVGTGRSATWTELAGFNASPDVTKKSWDEFVRCLPKMWISEKFEFEGEFWSMPRRTILPKVYQRPHPPMWVAVTSPGTELDAADRGLGSIGLTFGQFAEQDKRIAEYRRRIQLCEPVGEFVNDQVSTVNFLYCHEDDTVALKTGRQMANHFNYLAAQLMSVRATYPSKSYPSLGLLPQLRRQATGPEASEQAGEGLCLGGPERVTRALKRWEACGVDRVNFLINTAETIPQADVLASLRLFGKEVMPAFNGSKS